MSDKLRKGIIVFFSLLIALEAILVMLGWILGINSLTRFVPTGINMAFITALLFCLSALSLFLTADILSGTDNHFAPIILSGISLVIFLVTITIYIGSLFEITTGFENLFIRSDVSGQSLEFVAHTSAFSTLICFFLVGISNIFVVNWGSIPTRNIIIIGSLVFFAGVIALSGYVLDLPFLYYKFSSSAVPMALNTAILFIILGLGLIISSWGHKENEA